jgi:hypothetical protein
MVSGSAKTCLLYSFLQLHISEAFAMTTLLHVSRYNRVSILGSIYDRGAFGSKHLGQEEK